MMMSSFVVAPVRSVTPNSFAASSICGGFISRSSVIA